MKKNYERPAARKVSFQQIEDIADVWSGGSIVQGGGEWNSIPDETNVAYQFPENH